jgi:hypothetical protein
VLGWLDGTEFRVIFDDQAAGGDLSIFPNDLARRWVEEDGGGLLSQLGLLCIRRRYRLA